MPNANHPTISTHVLDTKRGEPAAGVPVTLSRIEGGKPVPQSTQQTDADGRIPNLGKPGGAGELPPGSYQIAFDVATYFKKKGDHPAFFSRVVLDFEISDGRRSYHIPLLVSPYSCASYRGS